MVKLSLFATATESRVDAENGILRGVRVISLGEAKGHSFMGEPIIVDQTTIAEVVSAAATFSDGVPVKLAHGTDIEELIGSIRDVVNDGDCARGNLYLLKSHENYATIIEMAETMPSNFGISISFMNAPEAVYGNDQEPDGDEDDEEDEDEAIAQVINPQYAEQIGNDIVAYAARVCELYSADLVQAPACNPSLFSEIMSEPATTPEVLAEAPVEEVKVEEITPAEEVATEVVDEKVQEELNAVIESETAPEEITSEVASEKAAPVDKIVEEAPVEAAIPAPAELSRSWNAVTTDLEVTRTELSKVQTELSQVQSDLAAARGEIATKDAQLVELNMLHRSVLSVMGLAPSIEIPEIANEAPQKSIIEQYESMPAGPERLSFFQANRREIERSIAAKLK